MSSIVTLSTRGDFKKTKSFLEKIKNRRQIYDSLNSYGQQGVAVLSAATPIRTGSTASAWSFKVNVSSESASIEWYNSKLTSNGDTPLVVLIIKGHGTGTGGYVPPNDFVTPAMESLCAEATDAVWKAVTSS